MKRLLAIMISLVVIVMIGCTPRMEIELSPLETSSGNATFFENIEPYTAGSNQEWALSTLYQLDNSEEKIRLYNYLLKAHTYLLLYDEKDYIDEYDYVKNMWLDDMPNYDAESKAEIQLLLDDENWIIDIIYPVEKPFKLSDEELFQVYCYFTDANPQFFLNQMFFSYFDEDIGMTPVICIPAYYAFADRRQEPHDNIQNEFDDFKLQLEKSIDISSKYDVVKYVYANVAETLSYSEELGYGSNNTREQQERASTILGYYSDSKQTVSNGYAAVMAYILNRLGIPAIEQSGSASIMREEQGKITTVLIDAWNIVQLNGEWYFLDATCENEGEYTWFLKGSEENDDSDFLHSHIIADDMIYPEVSRADYLPV